MIKRFWILGLTISFGLLIGGCATVTATVMGVKSSENQPIMTDLSDFEKHIRFMKSKENQTVIDELGSYYYKFYNNDTLYGAFSLPKEHETAKQLLVTGKGLLEPVFALDKKGMLVYDEKTTKIYHSALSKHLSLLPISDTSKVAIAIIKCQVSQRCIAPFKRVA